MEILLRRFLGPYNACNNNGYNDSGSSYGMLAFVLPFVVDICILLCSVHLSAQYNM